MCKAHIEVMGYIYEIERRRMDFVTKEYGKIFAGGKDGNEKGRERENIHCYMILGFRGKESSFVIKFIGVKNRKGVTSAIF